MNLPHYSTHTLSTAQGKLTYRAYRNIPYVKHPVSHLQVLHIFVPEGYYHGERIGRYDASNAPVFFPNAVGGYMEAAPCEVTVDQNGIPDGQAAALLHGLVVISAGARGRTTQSTDGSYIGKAPADIVDLKAAVRFIHALPDEIPGDKQCIISNGTSAGGAMSALLGASGDAAEYEPYLKELGAAEGSDKIYAASCYCPIINLEHADAAYEWQYGDLTASYGWTGEPQSHTMEQKRYAKELAAQFPAYVNSLELKLDGRALTLADNGEGSFAEYIKSLVLDSAREAAEYGIDIPAQSGISLCAGTVDFAKYCAFITRMKTPPAFDSVELVTAENELFGTETEFVRHFTEYAAQNSVKGGNLAPKEQIALMNPMNFAGGAGTVQYWRIRHGAADRDTSFAMSAMLALRLWEAGCDVDYKLPWGIPHAGNYDLKELFAWIDRVAALR